MFITFPITRGSSQHGEQEVTLAVDTIKLVRDFPSTAPVAQDGAKAEVVLKDKEFKSYHATIPRAEVEALLRGPKPALLRFKRATKKNAKGNWFGYDWFDVVAIVPADRGFSDVGHIGFEASVLVRTEDGISKIGEDEFWKLFSEDEGGPHYTEI
jgi:hypothetical protein